MPANPALAHISTVFTWIGYVFAISCATLALLWVYEQAMNSIWARCMDSRDFYNVVIEYAKGRRRKRKNDRVGFSDE